MGRIVITHVGTSAIECEAIKDFIPKIKGKNVPEGYKERVTQILNNHLRTTATIEKEWSEALQNGLRAIWSDEQRPDLSSRLKKSPVEIASLYLLDLQPGDRVILVYSATISGKFCSSLLQKCLVSTNAVSGESSTHILDRTDSAQDDSYTLYEIGLRQLLERLGREHPRANEALVYEQRLSENIANTRRYGDTDTVKADRSKIIDGLNQLAIAVLGLSFNELSKAPTSQIRQTQSLLEVQDENTLFRTVGLDVPTVDGLEGVEAYGGERFLSHGLPNYMQIVASERKAMKPGDKLYFNITGGYKGIVPFAVLAAQLLGDPGHTHSVPVEIVYAHEQSTQLISLTSLVPVDWRSLADLYPGICILVEKAGETAAFSLDKERWKAYLHKDQPGHPNALALAIYYLIKNIDLNWFEGYS